MIRVILLSMLLAACGGDSAVDQCDDLVSDLCTRVIECGGDGTHAACVATFQQVLSCGRAKAVAPSYGRCLAQLDAATCPALFPTDPQTGETSVALPADCVDVILF